ncbi:MAG: M20/M25/M40 family metallo-hydrolase [bacterium]|nr:M20/M25/M40 family metallo-hydrolase [bacterium]
MIDIKLTEDLSNAFGPSGFEEDVVKTLYRHCREEFSLQHDAMHNVFMRFQESSKERKFSCTRLMDEPPHHESLSGALGIPELSAAYRQRDFQSKKPLLMLDAHSDECGFMVQAIQENGLLSFLMLGGFHLTSLPAHSVLVRTQAGELVRGIITSKPVHFLTDKQRADSSLEIESLFIDVGACSRKEAMEEFGIRIGDPVVPEVTFSYQEKRGLCFGKAFDNRMGCASIVHTMRALKAEAKELAVDVVGAFAAQEEVGTRGASVTAAVCKPDLAIVFEGSPADDFFVSAGMAQGAMHGGVQLRRMDKSYLSNPAFLAYAREVAEKNHIRYQETVRRGGSTNAGKISLSGKAVPVLVLGIPARYVHSHYNFTAVEDMEATAALATEVIRNLDEERIRHIMRQDIV